MKIDIERIRMALNHIERYMFENDYSDVDKYIVYMFLAIFRRYKLSDFLSDEDFDKLDDTVTNLLAMLDDEEVAQKDTKQNMRKNMRKVPITDSMNDKTKEKKVFEDFIVEEGEEARKTVEMVSDALIKKLAEDIDTEKYGGLYYLIKKLRVEAVKKFGEDEIKKIEDKADNDLNMK